MKIANYKVAERFARRHPDSANYLRQWRRKVLNAQWRTPHDVPTQSSGIRRIGNRRLIFNIARNRYRLVAEVDYEAGALRILFIGRHASYDKIRAREV